MNSLHQKAIELKYEGNTYQEISSILGGEFTEGTLKQYFSENGILYLSYIAYAESMSEKALRESIALLRKTSEKASYALVNGLERAISNQDDTLILKYSTLILDRSGLGLDNLERILKKEESRRFKTYEEYAVYCNQVGIDPSTGLRSTSV